MRRGQDKKCRGWYAFFHEGKYYCFLHKDDSKCRGLDIPRILQEGGPDLLEVLRTIFDFVETGISSSDNKGSSSAIVRDNPNPEWEKAFARACLHFTKEDFPAFGDLELVDLEDHEGRFIGGIKEVEDLVAIDLDHDLFHKRYNTLEEFLVFSHSIPGLTKDITEKLRLEKLRYRETVEGGFWSQSFPLPHGYKSLLVSDLSREGYQFCSEESQGNAPILWRVKEAATGQDRCVAIFLPLPGYPPLHERHMAVSELLMEEPHPNLASVRNLLTLHGNPAVVMDAYDSDLETVMDELSRQQMNCVISQVVQGIVYLHRHGAVHHDINPSSILINIRQDVGETREEAVADDDSFRVEAAIYDFQSVAIPSARYLLQEHMEALSWGPFARPNLHETTDSGRIDRWLSGWAPKKTTRRFLRRDFGTANPWTIDCSSVAMMFLLNNMEIYEAYKASSVSDYRDHPEFSVFFNVVNLFQSHAKNAEDAIEELEATARTLSFDATAVNIDGGVGWDDSDFTQSS